MRLVSICRFSSAISFWMRVVFWNLSASNLARSTPWLIVLVRLSRKPIVPSGAKLLSGCAIHSTTNRADPVQPYCTRETRIEDRRREDRRSSIFYPLFSVPGSRLGWHQAHAAPPPRAQEADAPGAATLERAHRLAQRVHRLGRPLVERQDDVAAVQAGPRRRAARCD